MPIAPYIHTCDNDDCESDISVEILSVTLGADDNIQPIWEDSSPGYDGEVIYVTPIICPKCNLVQLEDKHFLKSIESYAYEAYKDSFYDDGQ